jgi:cyclase
MPTRMRIVAVLLGSFVLLSLAIGDEKDDLKKLKVKTAQLADGVYMLQGMGGNIGVVAGNDGMFMIDDDVSEVTPKIQAALRALSKKPVRFELNTHWHPDHTGGNLALAKAGAVIVAQENVRQRLSTEQFATLFNMKVPPSPPAALPIVTYADGITFHLNGEEIRVLHVPAAHTDGDSIVILKKANVIHMGDTYMTISYPFVDETAGGRYDGFIEAANRVLSMCDEKTKIIPGHGDVSDKAKLTAWRDMLVAIRDRVRKQVDAGKTLEQIQAAKLTAEWDAAWGVNFIKPEMVVQFAYDSLKKG